MIIFIVLYFLFPSHFGWAPSCPQHASLFDVCMYDVRVCLQGVTVPACSLLQWQCHRKVVLHSVPLLSLTLAIFPFLLPWRFLGLGEGDVQICFRVWVLNSHSLHFDLRNVCINCCPLQKEVSLAQVDNSTDLQVQTQIFRGSLPTGPFGRISVVNPAPGPVISFAVVFDYVLILETCGNLAAYFDFPTEHDWRMIIPEPNFRTIIGSWDPGYGNSLISLLSFLGQH